VSPLRPPRIIYLVARGWESKSIEEQQAAAQAWREPQWRTDAAEVAFTRDQYGLLLSRKHVQRQLQAAKNPRHRQMLESALAELDARLAQLV
jgi:hypothetical protein